MKIILLLKTDASCKAVKVISDAEDGDDYSRGGGR